MSITEEHDARNIFECLKVKMEVLVEQVESTVETMPISVPALQMRVESAKEAWGEFEQQYDKMRNATGDKRVADQVRAQEDHAQHADFQRRYYQALARPDNALINEQNAEDACLKALAMEEEAHLKASKVQQLNDK